MITTRCSRLSYLGAANRSLTVPKAAKLAPCIRQARFVSSTLISSDLIAANSKKPNPSLLLSAPPNKEANSSNVFAPVTPFLLVNPSSRSIIVRWKHAARQGNHLKVLDEMAHTKEREKAQERRQKKKDRKLKKKKGNKGAATEQDEEDDEEDSATKEESTGAFVQQGRGVQQNLQDDHDDDEDDDEGDEDEVELPDPSKIREKMLNIVSTYEDSLKSIRGAEPTPELFDDILVNAYDSENTPLKAVAQVVITSPTMASITCFDPSLVKEVRASIQMQLGLNPQTDASEGDAGVLKVPLPKVSLETRQQTAQQLSKKAEIFRQRIRRVRRRYNSIIKQGKDGKLEHISEDDVFRVAKEIDDVTEKAIKKLNDVTDKKHASIMDIKG